MAGGVRNGHNDHRDLIALLKSAGPKVENEESAARIGSSARPAIQRAAAAAAAPVVIVNNSNGAAAASEARRREDKKPEKKDESNGLLVLMFGVAGVGAAFLAGITGSEVEKLEKDVKEVEAFQDSYQLKDEKNPRFEPDPRLHENCDVCRSNSSDFNNLNQRLREIVRDIHTIRSKALQKQTAYSWGSRALVVPCIPGIVGAYFGIPWLTIAAVVATLACVIYLAYTLGTHWNDPTKLSSENEKERRAMLIIMGSTPPPPPYECKEDPPILSSAAANGEPGPFMHSPSAPPAYA